MIKIGIMQGRLVKSEKKNFIQSFPWKNWKKEFRLAKKNKIKILEWTLDHHKFKKNPLIDISKISLIKRLKKKYKIKIDSVTCDFYMQKPITKAKSPWLKKKIYNNIYKLILSCSKINIKYLVIPLVDNSSLSSRKEENQTVNFFLNFKDILKKHKIKILFEIDCAPKNVLKFISKFNNCYGINYDSGNSASMGYDINDEKIYFNKVYNIHIKDRIYNGPTVKLGHGDCNFQKLFKILKKINYKKNLILQTAKTLKNREVEEILDNIKFVKSI